jgi:acetyl-CoA synthetase
MTVNEFPQFDLSGVSSYEEAHERVEWDLPDTFNMGTAIIDRHADERGKVALFWHDEEGPDETWTYWQFRQRCNQFGNLLRERGFEQGDIVGVHLPQTPEAIVGHAGLWRAGSVSIPLPYTFEADSLRYRLDDAGAKGLLIHAEKIETVRELREDIESLETVFVVGDVDPEPGEVRLNNALDDHSTVFGPVETTPEDTGVILYSSGTTGQPKGIVHGHRILLAHFPGYQIIYNMDMEGVYYTPADWGWGGGLIDLVTAAMYHGQPLVGSNLGKFVPEEQYELLEEYGVTHGFIPPTALNMLSGTDDEPYDLDLEIICAGGESLSTAAHEWATERDIVINEFYGQTEANLLVANCEAVWGSKPGSMGRAMPGREVAVVDDDGERVETGEVGEVALRNPWDDPIWFNEYLNMPEETEAVLEDDWHLTSDLAEQDEDGYLWYHSRKDDVIISSGYRISPVEVEDAIMQHDSVVETAVVDAPDEVRGSIVNAALSEELKTEIQDHIKENLAKHEYPREIEFMDDLPKTESGKIRRKDLREHERERASSG